MPMRCTLTMQLLYRHCNLWILVTNSAVMQLPKMRNVNRLVRSLGFSSLPTQISPLPLDFQSLYAYISTSTAVSLSMALRYYINRYSPYHGLKIHTHILKIGFQPNTNISIKLLIMHLKCGYLDNARQVFDEMTQPTPAAYNYLMDGYVKHGRFGELFDLVRGMGDGNEKPDGFTYALILKAWISGCSSPFLRYDFGRQVHTHIVKSDLKEDIILFGSLLDAYVKCRRVHYARRLFDTNTMLLKNVICSTSLIAGYMSEGCVEDAEVIFEKTVNKDVVVLNAMIEGYSKSIETAKKAAEMYIDLKRMGFHPTVSTFASLIGACSLLTTVEIGQQVQCELMKMDCLNEIKIASALIDMYSKCGKVEDAHKIFDSMPERNVFSWTSLIDGYGKNGKPFEALELFRIMQKRHQITPNYITFLSVLSTCAHNGLLDEGKEIYRSMEKDFKLKPKMEHYACMVDLLGRFGSVDEAWRFIKGMPEKPDSDVWAALLSSCNLHGEVEIAKIAANELFKLGADGRPGSYVSLSNTLAAAGQWGGVINVRESMKLRRISKDTGFTKVGNDRSHENFRAG